MWVTRSTNVGMRANPTGRQLRLGRELRKLRERSGLTATDAAALIGIKANQVSNIEAGRHGVSAERVRAMACHYACPDKDLVEALAAMTSERKRQWWEDYRETLSAGLLDLAEMEVHGHGFRTAHTSGIPGLLQTPEHAREVFLQVVPELSPREIEQRASFRLKRQAVLFHGNAPHYQAIIHEAALHMRFGGRDVARHQLKHLLKMTEHPNISIQVLPFDAGGYPGAGQPIYYVQGPVPQLDTVQLDQSHGVALLDAEAQLLKYRTVLDRLAALSLIELESRALIHRIIREL